MKLFADESETESRGNPSVKPFAPLHQPTISNTSIMQRTRFNPVLSVGSAFGTNPRNDLRKPAELYNLPMRFISNKQ